MDDLLDRLQVVFDICFESGITLSIDKLIVADTVPFAGFIVSTDSIKPDPAKIDAISKFPAPKNLSDHFWDWPTS